MDMQRGRPRHPDILAPKQWQVLDCIRDGLSDQDIAERLGVSLDGAKYHVSEILSKLGVAKREEAASWQPEEPRARGLSDRWFARAIVGAGLGVTATAVGGVAILGLAVVSTPTTEGNVSVEHAREVAEQRFEEEVEFGQLTFVRYETITWEDWWYDTSLDRRLAFAMFFETPEGCPEIPDIVGPCSTPLAISPGPEFLKVTFQGYIYRKDQDPRSYDSGGCRELEILVSAGTGELAYETYELLQPPYPPSVCDTVPTTPIRPD